MHGPCLHAHLRSHLVRDAKPRICHSLVLLRRFRSANAPGSCPVTDKERWNKKWSKPGSVGTAHGSSLVGLLRPYLVDRAGLLMDVPLRTVFRPPQACIRDWMHCLVGDGVANTTIALMLHALMGRKIKPDVVQEFSLMCTLPHKYGKVDKTWFDRKRLKDSTIASFASIILSMIPILYLFL